MNVGRQGYEKKTAKANGILPTLQASSTPQRFYKRRLRTTGYPLKQIVVSLLSLTLSFFALGGSGPHDTNGLNNNFSSLESIIPAEAVCSGVS
jgi:hypothetical protein